MSDFEYDLHDAVLEKAWKENDAAWAELQAFLKEQQELSDKGQPMPQVEAQAQFRELMAKHQLTGERIAAMFDALWARKTGNA
jgi:hypothetical protein